MPKKTSLKIDWATHKAAKYACENWHYSKCVPSNKLVKIGVWEFGKFIGVVIFSPGASSFLGKSYGVAKTEVCELTRLALREHSNPVSRIMSIAIRFLKKSNPKLKLIISFADPRQDHYGGIYQAGNWIYTGISTAGGALEYWINGKWVHHRSVGAKFGYSGKALINKTGFKTRKPTRKHRYLMPLTEKTREKIIPLSKPYPKRAGSKDSVVSDFQSGGGGANPTSALQTRKSEADNEKV